MTKYFSALGLLFVVFVAGLISFSSCTKTNTVIKTDTLTVTKIDTIVHQDTLLRPEVLTANPWMLKEMVAQFGNGRIIYVRGGSHNTLDYDNEYVTFNPDHTGQYVDNTGTSTALTWEFTDSVTIKWVWYNPYVVAGPVNITWQHVRYKNGAIYYTEFFIQDGSNELEDAIRIPKDPSTR